MLKNYFKKFCLVALFVVALIFPLSIRAQEPEYFELIIDTDVSKVLHGVEHRRITGSVRTGTRIVKQQINYTAANILTDENLFAVVGDNYIPHGFGMGHIRGQTFVINQRFQYQAKVVSAVNGDFYIIRHEDPNYLGMTIGSHIIEYRTIHEGDHSRPLIGFHDDGSVTIGPPEYKGYQVIVLDNAGSKKQKEINVAGFNRLPEEGEVTAFFWNHTDTISSPEPKMVFKGIDVKTTQGSVGRYFAEGTLNYITTEDVTLERGDFLLMGEDIFSEGLITEEETVIVHNVLGGIHEGIRSGCAGGQMLVVNGERVVSDNTDVHPRTAVGVKADGTVFFVTIDGRFELENIPGMDYEQLSYLMLYFGAETAINVDGGGSSTMLFYNPETDYYDTMNRPSDNPLSLRSVANGMFFLYGNLEAQLPPSPYPDTREILTKPSHFYFGEDKMLKFDAVPNAEYYTIRVNGREKYRTTTNSYQFDFDYGTYELEIQAFGDFASYKQSSIETIEVSVFTPGVSNLIEGLKKYGQSANRK
ncbi:MAG: phosphodiester glycosidase family protein [Acholeplasmatales bacterium]|jgi:hypothetical protein|nr:phosphodiester glycosidase family protein [Acholeplasmatales bacterium]NLL89451.1 phosphodiester glycosidase family protein [Bacillota bacterium]